MEPFSTDSVRAAYDAVAVDYARAFGDDLGRLPLDRAVLDAAFAAAPRDGWVLEAGCGPAPAAAYLSDRASLIVGVDVSAGMLDVARSRQPQARWTQGDLRRLPLRAGSCALVIAYYSLQHVHRAELPAALGEARRVLRDDGVLALAMHLGEGEVVHTGEFLGHPISNVAGALYARDELVACVTAAGFELRLERQRGPLPHESDTHRLYLVAAATSARPSA